MTDEDLASRRVRTISRYSELARSALQGASIADCEPDAFAGGQFGAAAYSDRDDAPASVAHVNATKAGIGNVRFMVGHIEEIPLPSGHVDVVISNCVVNLSGDKPKVLAEAFRVLRPGGRLGISDVIAEAGVDLQAQAEAEHHVGCASGTLTQAEYERLLAAAGFTSVSITVTTDAGGGLHSAIVRAAKPATA